MTINCRLGDVDARGLLTRARRALEAEHRAVVRDVVAVADVPRGAIAPVACEEVIPGGGPHFQAIYKQGSSCGRNVQAHSAAVPECV